MLPAPTGDGGPVFLTSKAVHVQVAESFRGAAMAGHEAIVFTGSGGGDCGYPFCGRNELSDFCQFLGWPDDYRYLLGDGVRSQGWRNAKSPKVLPRPGTER